MDLATIGGIAAALVFLLLGIIFAQGSFLLFVNMPSVMITVGGSFAALLASYPLTYIIGMGKIIRFAFFRNTESPASISSEIPVFLSISFIIFIIACEVA